MTNFDAVFVTNGHDKSGCVLTRRLPVVRQTKGFVLLLNGCSKIRLKLSDLQETGRAYPLDDYLTFAVDSKGNRVKVFQSRTFGEFYYATHDDAQKMYDLWQAKRLKRRRGKQ